jgi:hypothetical protein
MLIAGLCFIIGLVFVKETNHVDIDDASASSAAVSQAAGEANSK